jgi:hypothetical protein
MIFEFNKQLINLAIMLKFQDKVNYKKNDYNKLP